MAEHLEALTRACDARARIDEWTISQRREQRALRTEGAARGQLLADSVRSRVHVYRDVRRGRGAAWFDLHPDDELGPALGGATARARDNLGPPWRLPRPAAPARVSVADAQAFADPQGEAARVAELFARALKATPGLISTSLDIEVVARIVDVRTSTGFAGRYRETQLRYRATIANASTGPVEQVRGYARRAQDLQLGSVLDSTARSLSQRASAVRAGAGRFDILLIGDALQGSGHDSRGVGGGAGAGGNADTGSRNDDGFDSGFDYGWWLPIVAQSSATLARQGLSRYRLGQTIYGDREATGDRLSLRSDGTVDFAPYSAPFGQRGEPVRAFDLVRDGVAVGHPLDIAEAGLRKTTPNGGARNLVVSPGTTPRRALAQATGRPLLTISKLAWLDIDPRTGALVADIALAHLDAGGSRQTVSGGSIRGNLFELLGRARFSRETESRGWLNGPEAIRLDNVEIA